MKKKLIALMLAGFCATPTLVQAAPTPYASASIGLGFAKNADVSLGSNTIIGAINYKTAGPFAGGPLVGALGLKGDNYRIEAAVGYQKYSADSISIPATTAENANVSITTYMANAYFDDELNESRFIPYIIGGLGVATINPTGTNFEASAESVFAWQVGGGIGVKATNNLVVDLGYRYLSPSASTVTVASPSYGTGKLTFGMSNILLGMRYNF